MSADVGRGVTGARGLTLQRTLALGLAGLALSGALLFGLLLHRWGDSLLAGSERLREAASRSAEAKVSRLFASAEGSLRSVEKEARSGVVDLGDPVSIERALFAQLLGNPDIAEVTLSRGQGMGADADLELAPRGRWQVSVFREGGETPRIVTRHTHEERGRFVIDERARPPGSIGFEAARFERARDPGRDPTQHITFRSAVEHRRFSASPLWTDLHYAEVDAKLPEASRRVVVAVMTVLEDEAGRLLGVIRVALVARRLEEISRIRVDERGDKDAHRVFLADDAGRLITGAGPGQRLEDQDGDLRVATSTIPEEIRTALAQPALRGVDAEHLRGSSRFEVGSRGFLLSVLYLEGAQDWRVGIVVPEDHYLGDLQRVRKVLLATSMAAFLVMVGIGAAAVRSVQRSLGRMEVSAARMRDFDFTPAAAVSPFRDVEAVMEDLEQAKTALRAMGKYVPIDLVRQLYRSRKEPVLGGELRNVTLLFTDIQDFTTFSERLAPDVLAEALGRYLQAMTSAIHATGGTVDKYIGDAVMALWNAPEPRSGHATLACRAALACLGATRALFDSPAWEGLPAFHTRFGLHRADVMVGHFGAPDRISYTALGDGVNLASRLEGLNKAYGTTILASQDVRDSAGEGFAFRLVDLVAVKGKTVGVRVYELLGLARDLTPETLATIRTYEEAFEDYRHRRFADAADRLERQQQDPPSKVLRERCQRYREAPPPASWDGTHTARDK